MKRVIIAILVLSFIVLSFLAGGWHTKRSANGSGTAERNILYYVDPMNPGFRSDKPGTAPCGMPLEPVYADGGETAGREGTHTAMPPGVVKISPARQQLIGVRVQAVEKKPVSYSLRLYGKVVPDEARVFRLNPSTEGWIKAVSPSATTGSFVRKNEKLAILFNNNFLNAQQNYVYALQQIEKLEEKKGEPLAPQQYSMYNNNLRTAVQNLENLGFTQGQIRELAKSRRWNQYFEVRSPVDGYILARNITTNQWFGPGSELFRIADISHIWVLVDVYENEARYLTPGMTAHVTEAQMKKTFLATVSRVLPLFDQATKTLKVRLETDNPGLVLRPDMFVDVEIPVTMPAAVTVPSDAVIDSGASKVVYVDRGGGTFEPRRVDTGWRLGRQVQITGGLMPGEQVVVSGNFLIDSESRMRLAASGGLPEMVRDPVCGMYVEEGKVKAAGKTAEYKGETYYFCSDQCRQDFEKDPEKYIGTEKVIVKDRDHAAVPAAGHDHTKMKKRDAAVHTRGSGHDAGGVGTGQAMDMSGAKQKRWDDLEYDPLIVPGLEHKMTGMKKEEHAPEGGPSGPSSGGPDMSEAAAEKSAGAPPDQPALPPPPMSGHTGGQ